MALCPAVLSRARESARMDRHGKLITFGDARRLQHGDRMQRLSLVLVARVDRECRAEYRHYYRWYA